MVNILKTIGKIIIILVVAAFVAGGLYLVVQNGSTNSATAFNNQQFQTSGSTSQPQFRPEGGDFDGGHAGNFNLAQGLAGMIGSLMKIVILVTLVLFVQNLIANMKRRSPISGAV